MQGRKIRKRKEVLQARIDFISSAIRENKIEHHQLQKELQEQLREFEIRKILKELIKLKKELEELNRK